MPKIKPLNEMAFEPVRPTVMKSRLKRLFERQFPRTSYAEKVGVEEPYASGDVEPSSVCLTKMVQNFMEEREDKHGKNRCNCFNGNCSDSSEDEKESCDTEILKNLFQCENFCERKLLVDTMKLAEKNKACKSKDGSCKREVANELIKLGYDASVCKSRWEKTLFFPAGEYEYIDVILDGERLIVDIDFRSEFEIARATKAYKLVLLTLPDILVVKPDRLKRIIAIVSEAAKQSLKKRGMHVPPWRKVNYVKAKWFSPYTRTTQLASAAQAPLTASPDGRIKHEEIQYPLIKPPKSTSGGTPTNTNSADDFEQWIVSKPKSTAPSVKKSGAGGLASIMKLEP